MSDAGRSPAGQRQTERFNLRLAVGLVIPGREGEVQAVTRNISIGGVFVETELDLPFDTRIEVRLALPTSRDPLVARGRVRWVEKQDRAVTGLGVQFEGLHPKDVWALNKVLADAKR